LKAASLSKVTGNGFSGVPFTSSTDSPPFSSASAATAESSSAAGFSGSAAATDAGSDFPSTTAGAVAIGSPRMGSPRA
jgi:hypothetical protein